MLLRPTHQKLTRVLSKFQFVYNVDRDQFLNKYRHWMLENPSVLWRCISTNDWRGKPLFRSVFEKKNTLKKEKNLGLDGGFVKKTRNAARATLSYSTEIKDGETVRQALRCFSEQLEKADIPEPVESVSLLIAHVLSKPTLHGVPDSKLLNQTEVRAVYNMVQQRLQRIPVQYILGEWDFCDLTLRMRPPVFIPRPETEELVSFITKHVQQLRSQQLRILDLCCGSGAISLALLKKFPQMSATAVDKQIDACTLTKENAALHDLNDQITVINRDVTQGISDLGRFHLIVSNPPYINSQDMDLLDAQVSRYEDQIALHGGSDGLSIITSILAQASSLLMDEGSVWMEVDTSHPQQIKKLVNEGHFKGLRYVRTIQDFTSRDRFCFLKTSQPNS